MELLKSEIKISLNKSCVGKIMNANILLVMTCCLTKAGSKCQILIPFH